MWSPKIKIKKNRILHEINFNQLLDSYFLIKKVKSINIFYIYNTWILKKNILDILITDLKKSLLLIFPTEY